MYGRKRVIIRPKLQNQNIKEILVSSREGLNITSRDLKKIDLLFHHLSLNGNQYLIFLHIINMNLIILKEHYTIILTKMFLKLEILIYQVK